jgi:tetratricopeptide (TPR) repeat protein/transcriptional regulator with XRE-family HTH domain
MFGDVVRAHRQRLGLSQDELAARSGVSVRGLRKIESNGTDRPRAATVRLLADAFALVGAERDRFCETALAEPAIVVRPAGSPEDPLADAAAGPVAPLVAPLARGVPAQLPFDVSAFTGRTSELRELDEAFADGSAALVVVSGTAGVGKTSLAVHWGHRARSRFPDGQLYVDLRGYDPEQPMAAPDALAKLLTGLGLPGAEVPVDADERAARYRTETAGRRLLIVLDNASSVEQVRLLLPGSGPCAVLVTSRDALAGLVAVDGARRIVVDLLPDSDARQLLRRLIGRRVDAEPAAAEALADQCARLPLALRIAAELAVSRSDAQLSEISTELAGQQRLELLDTGGDPRAALRTVFSWSVDHLPPLAARTFALFSLHPGPDADALATAALLDVAPADARRTLDQLSRAHLTHRTTGGRFGMHDLLRAYGASLPAHRAADATRVALTRLFDYYRAGVAAAVDFLYPSRIDPPPAVAATAAVAPSLSDADQASRWLETELTGLGSIVAYTATHGWPGHAVKLSALLQPYLNGRHPAIALTIHQHALDAARQSGDRRGEGQALFGLGMAYSQHARMHAAITHLEQAIAAFDDAGDRSGQGRALSMLGLVVQRTGGHDRAADYLREADRMCRAAGDVYGRSSALRNLGLIEGWTGDYAEAKTHLWESWRLIQTIGDGIGEASTLNNLAMIEERHGDADVAFERLRRALEIAREMANQRCEASVLDSFGTVYAHQGEHALAIQHYDEALALFRRLDDTYGQTCALNGLGEVAQATGRPADAIRFHLAALELASRPGTRRQVARANEGLGNARASLGEATEAREHRTRAIELYAELGMSDADDLRALLAVPAAG